MDVDGVLNPYPDCPSGYREYTFFHEDEEPVRLADIDGEWLRELGERYTLVWASAWGENANLYLCPHFGLPPVATVSFPPAPFEARAKVPAIDAFAGDRPAAWVDDLLTPEAWRWAGERAHPTLLVEVDHAAGLARRDVDLLLTWPPAHG